MHKTYVSFQSSILALYFLARRWVRPWAAFGTALLFSTQPLLWGHAFINPKDMPFMAFFLVSVTAGLYAIDSVLPPAPEKESLVPALKTSGQGVVSNPIHRFFQGFGLALRSPWLLFAAVLLGLTVSIRVIGPLAGVIVAIYALGRSFKRSLPVLTCYALVALLVSYISWPFLWPAPIENFLFSIKVMSQYAWIDPVLFNGIYYAPNKLPWYYLPELFSLQMTEPVLLLAAAGLLLVIFRRGKYWTAEFAGLAAWLIIPLAGPILVGSTLYDNFRQFLFILPPLFILAGISLEYVLGRINPAWLKTILLLILILPGLYAAAILHPYEYTYYNSLVGGTGGAFRRFEMDYWSTSFAEAADFLNRSAPPNASVVVLGPDVLFRTYARPDLRITTFKNAQETGRRSAYFVTTTRWNYDQRYCQQDKILYTVGKDKAVFAIIKQLSKDNVGCP